MKRTFYTEAAYAAGLFALALGTALMERADFGMSMVVAPAYLLHLKVSQTLGWFSFGMAEFCFQACLIAVLAAVLRRFRRRYLFSFLTAFLYGTLLDVLMQAAALLGADGFLPRAAWYAAGQLICSAGVALLFHTYIPLEAYELFVKELSDRFHLNISRTKTVYDCCSCALALALSFLFFGFGRFEGGQAGDAAVRAGERLAHRAVQRPAGKALCLCGCARSCKAPGLSGRRRQGAHRPPAATVTGPPARAATATAAPRRRRAR